ATRAARARTRHVARSWQCRVRCSRREPTFARGPCQARIDASRAGPAYRADLAFAATGDFPPTNEVPAIRCGSGNVRSFQRAFKARSGSTPGQMREAIAPVHAAKT